MNVDLVCINANVTESGANTYTNTKKEIPGSEGAKRVTLLKGKLDVDTPDLEDAINEMRGAVLVGDRTDRTSLAALSTAGSICRYDEVLNSDGTDVLFHVNKGTTDCVAPWDIPKGPDGRFYITLEAQGVGNASAKYAHFAGSFRIER
jgi:hypothetical protein